jgi:hypothetical protein
MSAQERIAGDITEGAIYIKRGAESDKVSKSLEQALSHVKIEWIEE